MGDVAAAHWRALPSGEALSQLEAAAASAFGLSGHEQVAAVPGSDIAIRLLARLLPGRTVAIAGQGYSGYRAAWPGARPTTFAAACDADLMICANPNNPDGATIDHAAIRSARGIRIVDEAFADAMPGVSILPDRQDAIVLRSFGKFFGLAGVRLGFVIADSLLIGALRQMLGDWPISGPAIAIGTAAYRDADWQAAQRDRLRRGSARLTMMLTRHGLRDLGGTANFRLCEAPDAIGLFTHLCRSGILVRPFTDRPGQLRFGIAGDEAEWHRLDSALQAWRAA